MYRVFTASALLSLLLVQTSAANPLTELLKAAGRAAFRKTGSEAARHGTKQVLKQSATHSARKGLGTVARSRATQTIRAFGDDAVRAGASKAPAYADDLAKASASLSARNHRRLLMLAPELKKSGRAAHVARQLAKSKQPNQVLDAIWRNRAGLAAATAATAVVIHGDDLAEAGGQYVAKPLVESAMEHVARPIVRTLTTMLWVGVPLVGLCLAFKFTTSRRQVLALVGTCHRIVRSRFVTEND